MLTRRYTSRLTSPKLGSINLFSASPASFSTRPKMIGHPQQVTYTSNDVPIPDSFLTTPPAKPITCTPVAFAAGGLPQYQPHTCVVLDNVLSPAECREMLRLAEASVPGAGAGSGSPWKPALVSLGPGVEARAPGYRESDRIVWDQQTVVDRLWGRCARADGLRELLASVREPNARFPGTWVFSRFNARMRFLKYSPGQYFKPHVDGPYWCEEGEREFLTHYTVHLYLNDSKEIDPEADLVGGATAFLSRDRETRLDVNPKAGSVLLFQHEGLLHEGAKVLEGTKYTMRTDILYEFVPDKAAQKAKASKAPKAEK